MAIERIALNHTPEDFLHSIHIIFEVILRSGAKRFFILKRNKKKNILIQCLRKSDEINNRMKEKITQKIKKKKKNWELSGKYKIKGVIINIIIQATQQIKNVLYNEACSDCIQRQKPSNQIENKQKLICFKYRT